MKKRNIAIMVTAGAIGCFLLGSVITFELQPPEVITKTVEAVSAPPATVEVSPVVLVNAMESRFESITFSMNLTAEDVKVGVCNGNAWQQFMYRDCIMMQVPAEVAAGFGRDILDQKRITATKSTITFDIGTPSIYKPNINHARVKVLNPNDEGGVWSDPDKNLQAKGFIEAEKKLRQAACAAGIFRAAALSAEKQYGDLFRSVLNVAGDTRTVKIVYDIPSCS